MAIKYFKLPQGPKELTQGSIGRSQIDPQAIVEQYQGPALVLGDDVNLLANNIAAEPFCAIIADLDKDNRDVQVFLENVVARITNTGNPVMRRVELLQPQDPGAGSRWFDLVVLPVYLPDTTGASALVLAHEITLERNLTKALVTSRELFRDLVNCSSDFAWETDCNGVFIYVSARGAAGFSPQSLNGQQAQSLIAPSAPGANAFPFSTRQKVEAIEVWVNGADGESHCMMISSLPVTDESGDWCGTRGVGRDVTELRAREREVDQAHARDRLVTSIADAIRAELDPGDMLKTAAQEIVEALFADFGYVLRYDLGDANTSLTIAGAFEGSQERDDPEGIRRKLLACVEPYELEDALPFERSVEGVSCLICATHFANGPNGALCIVREGENAEWSDAERDLLSLIAGHVGIAIAQSQQVEALRQLSRTDGLTGLLNRRSFTEEMTNCLIRNKRAGRSSSLLYIDVDDFKRVNDTLGHAAGDKVLTLLADRLKSQTRESDLAVRLGGDEFALWLDNCDEADAIKKAKQVLAAARTISKEAMVPWPVGVSVGVTCVEPHEDIRGEAMISLADKALYISKDKGKNCWALVRDAQSEKTSDATFGGS